MADFPDERREEAERQLVLLAGRGRLIQRALTSFYVSLGIFVATTIGIGLAALCRASPGCPTTLGAAGTLVLFYGCVMLIGETRLSLRSVDLEMEFALKLRELYQSRLRKGSGALEVTESRSASATLAALIPCSRSPPRSRSCPRCRPGRG